MNSLKPFVLLVEDNNLIARAAQLSLRKFDILVDIAHNGKEAVAATRLRRYSLVLMDVEMPIMDGIDATESIRSDEQNTGHHVPIVGVTAMERPLSCLAHGMDACVTKPANYAALVAEFLDG